MKIGTNDVVSVSQGENAISKIYFGNTEVWSAAPAAFTFTIQTSGGVFAIPTNNDGMSPVSYVIDWGDGDVSSQITDPWLSPEHTYSGSTEPVVFTEFVTPNPSDNYITVSGTPFNTTLYIQDYTSSLPIITSDYKLKLITVYGNYEVTINNIQTSNESLLACETSGSTWLQSVEEILDIQYAISTFVSYEISIVGDIGNIAWSNSYTNNSNLQVREIKSWGNLKLNEYTNFSYCANLTCTATDQPTFTSPYALAGLFTGCTSFTGGIQHWDISGQLSLNSIFADSGFNEDISSWDTSNVTDMTATFSNSSFNQPIGSWNTGNVTKMQQMFANAVAFNQSIGNWNVSKVTNMQNMFYRAMNFNQPIGNWNVSSVTTMNAMFMNAYAFNQPIGNWNMLNVTNIASMFRNAYAFSQDVSDWNIINVNDFAFFKVGGSFSTTIMDAIYNKWSALNVKTGKSISFGSSKYTSAGSAGRSILTTAVASGGKGWTITDGGII